MTKFGKFWVYDKCNLCFNAATHWSAPIFYNTTSFFGWCDAHRSESERRKFLGYTILESVEDVKAYIAMREL